MKMTLALMSGHQYLIISLSNEEEAIMKKVLLNIYRGIVGNEYGWNGEGNEQWYYFLALVMNCMLTWWLKPEIGILFTV